MTDISRPFTYTRKDYLNNTVSHHDYYKQMVKPALVEFVKTRLKGASAKPPLEFWDNAACTANVNGLMPSKLEWEWLKDYPTQAGLVCIVKTAAQMAAEQEQQ